ncbi:uncharacterized protein CIMG_00553 [Coccidioides immitis RS]|uniref:Uncharacterized protein n=3 Tax=Coccidioides immitis TaxID=5501 RepID=J3KH88_COCIM|nr:uncharacterized protein CIMG_00553 [Coccidioides immitis RS]EAS35199.3 hypothetical protein CIMG_00553 [Coccidioides immitis RS]KMP00427.1 hypothetical protein CIRG_00569 [Coccidioides immitis RMSCC 2394]KMU84623.1 hypothetical protein CIHG_02407 [Coccidioides immitis H538.4]TPX26507.1 hypothetical protein DIZ76_011969 [Coccidioides immitis]
MSPFRFVEPLPTASTTGRRQALYGARTAATNTAGLRSDAANSGSSRRISSSCHRQGCSSARNTPACHSSEFAIFSFDEELEYELRREKEAAPVFHVGRNGDANIFRDSQSNYTNSCNYSSNFPRKQSTTSSMSSSNQSTNLEKTTWMKRDTGSWRSSFNHLHS